MPSPLLLKVFSGAPRYCAATWRRETEFDAARAIGGVAAVGVAAAEDHVVGDVLVVLQGGVCRGREGDKAG